MPPKLSKAIYLTVALLLLPLQLAASPFNCEPNFYQVHDNGAAPDSIMAKLEFGIPASEITFGTSPQTLNALAYNPNDDYLYAIIQGAEYRNQLVRIGSDGEITNLGTIPGLPTDFGLKAGDFGADGFMYVKNRKSLYRNTIYKININTLTATTITLNDTIGSNDFSYNPETGKFYGLHDSNLIEYTINGSTGTVTASPLSGMPQSTGAGATFYSNGFFAYSNNTGAIYRINVQNKEAQHVATSLANLTSNDGASCPSAQPPFPLITAADDTAETQAGQAVTINVLANDSAHLTSLVASNVTVVSAPGKGGISVNANGTIAYIPSQSGTDQFTYQVCDNQNNCGTANVTVQVLGTSFACESAFYQVHGDGRTASFSNLSRLQFGSPPSAVAFGSHNQTLNTLAYNPIDNYLYALITDSEKQDELVRIDSSGGVKNLGKISGLEAEYPLKTGDFDANGYLYTRYSKNRDSNKIFKIDVNNLTASTITLDGTVGVNDFSYDPNTDKFYGVQNSQLTEYTFNGSSGTIVTSNIIGIPADTGAGATFYSNGFYAYENESGFIYKIDLQTKHAEHVATSVADLPQNDGASCPTANPPFSSIVANDDEITIYSNSTGVYILVLQNDQSHISSIAPETLTITQQPEKGLAQIPVTGVISYQPSSLGTDTLNYQICNNAGQCDIATVTINILPTYDFGDAPVNDGVAQHVFYADGPLLGNSVSTESTTLIGNGNADADSFDDAIKYAKSSIIGTRTTAKQSGLLNFQGAVLITGQTTTIHYTTQGAGTLYSFIDFNRDGDFLDDGEALPPQPSTGGSGSFNVQIPTTANTGTSFARFRYSTDDLSSSPNGMASNGEVEDYLVIITTPIALSYPNDSDGDSLSDQLESELGTDPNNPDSDGDNLNDGYEHNVSQSDPLDSDSDDDGLTDGEEVLTHGSSPTTADTDGDGLNDGQEQENNTSIVNSDTDGDGLSDDYEINTSGTDPFSADSDNDGLNDGTEVNTTNTNPLVADTDGDGLQDGQEHQVLGTDPLQTDTDNDGLSDGYEVNTSNTNPTLADSDGDNLSDADEINTHSTDPNSQDSDNDGLNDDVEINIYQTDPTNADTDGDTISDGTEVHTLNTAPTNTDTDSDNLSDSEEINTNPLQADSDSDGLTDDVEIALGSDPVNPDSDGDGLNDSYEVNSSDSTLIDTDADGIPDVLDTDDDNDGIPTSEEISIPDGSGNPTNNQPDEDGNGVPDYLETKAVPETSLILNVKVLLQGAYNHTTQLMNDTLRSKGVLPATQPYAPPTIFNYAGDETLDPSLLTVAGDTAIVDWVLLELRDETREVIHARRAALLQRNGDVVDAQTGSTDIEFPEFEPGNFHVTLIHRNHLAVMTDRMISLSETTTLVDFTQSATEAYGSHERLINSQLALLWTGDVGGDQRIIANGPDNDLNRLFAQVLIAPNNTSFSSNFMVSGYQSGDLTMDNNTLFAGPNNDTNLIIGNILLHPGNSTFSANYIINGSVPTTPWINE